ncbi:DUF3492 domain-containing protein [Streptomyces sp. NPDC003691]
MRIGLLTDGGYPSASGGSAGWCDRLVRGLAQHEFDIYAGRAGAAERAGGASGATGAECAAGLCARHSLAVPPPVALPPQVRAVRTASPAPAGRGDGPAPGRRWRRRFLGHFTELVTAVRGAGAGESAGGAASGAAGFTSGAAAAGFADGLYGLAALAREHGGLAAALRSEPAVRTVESVCRTPGAHRSVHTAAVPDYLAFAGELERALRPLSYDWYGDDALGSADLCHAVSGGATALPGLLAKRFFGVPLLVTEYGVDLRAHYLAAAPGGGPDGPDGPGSPDATAAGPRGAAAGGSGMPGACSGAGEPGAYGPLHGARSPLSAPVRALLAAFRRALAGEVYAQASLITPGDAHIRRWQRKCGADPAKLRTVHPGVDTDRYTAVGEAADPGDPYTLVWIGSPEPGKDLVGLVHAFAEVHRREPRARLRLFARPARDGEDAAYLAHCRSLAAHLFADGAVDARPPGAGPVFFETLGGPGGTGTAEACASGAVTVSASTVEGFPHTLVEAMLCGRATVSTDAGAVVEVIGGTGLVVPQRHPRALAEACLALIGDPARAARLGAAARSRALELFTSDRNTAAFRALYLEVISHSPVHRDQAGPHGEPLPFAHPAEALVPMVWARREPALTGPPPPAAEGGGRPGRIAPVAGRARSAAAAPWQTAPGGGGMFPEASGAAGVPPGRPGAGNPLSGAAWGGTGWQGATGSADAPSAVLPSAGAGRTRPGPSARGAKEARA